MLSHGAEGQGRHEGESTHEEDHGHQEQDEQYRHQALGDGLELLLGAQAALLKRMGLQHDGGERREVAVAEADGFVDHGALRIEFTGAQCVDGAVSATARITRKDAP